MTGLYPAGRAAPGTSIAYRPDSTGLLVTAADGRTWTVDTRLLHLGLSTARAPQASLAGRQSSGPMVARASAATTSTR